MARNERIDVLSIARPSRYRDGLVEVSRRGGRNRRLGYDPCGLANVSRDSAEQRRSTGRRT